MNNDNNFTRLTLAASPCNEFAKTQLSLKENNLRHWNSPRGEIIMGQTFPSTYCTTCKAFLKI